MMTFLAICGFLGAAVMAYNLVVELMDVEAEEIETEE